MLVAIRATLVVVSVILVALIIRAALTADFFASFAAVAANPWGLVGLVDLYLGFVMWTVVMVALDGRSLEALVWVIALWILGNVAGALWLILRVPRLLRALSAS